jgi:site-specific recombinase XerC
MLSEIEAFVKWLRRKAPQSSTARHYGNDLELFFAWLAKPCQDVKVQDIDAFIEHSQARGHAIATVNRRLAALRSFYHFLAIERDDAPRNPVIPKRHFIRHGLHLPRDVEDTILQQLFAVIGNERDRAMFLLMLRCGLRVGEVRNLSLHDLYLEPSFGSLPRLWVHGKGNGQRVAYLSAQPLVALQAWLAIRPSVEDEAVFLNRFGRRFTVTGIQDRLARYCNKAGLWLTCTSRMRRCRPITKTPCRRSPRRSHRRRRSHTCACPRCKHDPLHRQTPVPLQERDPERPVPAAPWRMVA